MARHRDRGGHLAAHLQGLPTELRASLTWGRGMELADHKRFSMATDVAVYFCDPQSPWQRRTNEITNGLLGQYFPKRTDLSIYSQTYSQTALDAIAAKLKHHTPQDPRVPDTR